MVGGFDLLLKAIDVALDLRKIGLAILGTLVIVIVTSPFGIGGAVLAGAGLADAMSGMFSGRTGSSGNVMVLLGGCLNLVAVLLFFVLLMVLFGAIARMSYADLSGNFRAGILESVQFAFRNALSLVFSPIVLVIVAVALSVLEIILFLPGRVPDVGVLWVACISLPLLIVNMGLILINYFGLLLIPAIVAVESTNAMATLTTLMNVVRRAPGRLIGYWIVALPLILIVLGVLLYVFFGATLTTAGLATLGGGTSGGLGLTNPITPFGASSPFGPSFNPFGTSRTSTSTMTIAMLITSIGVSVILAIVFAFVVVVLPMSVSCAIYMSVRA